MSPHRKGRREAAKRRQAEAIRDECLENAKRMVWEFVLDRHDRLRYCTHRSMPGSSLEPVRMLPIGISKTVELKQIRYAMVQAVEERRRIPRDYEHESAAAQFAEYILREGLFTYRKGEPDRGVVVHTWELFIGKEKLNYER